MPRRLSGHLTNGQRDALRLAAAGFTSREIGQRLGTTEQAIHLRLKAAAVNLGGRTRTHTVVIAIRRRIINLDDIRHLETGEAA